MDKDEQEVANHKADRLSDINLRRIRSIKEGQGRDSLPEELQLNCHKKNNGHRHLDTYGRMSWDQPGPTITARFDSFSRGRFGHPVLDSLYTPILSKGRKRVQILCPGFAIVSITARLFSKQYCNQNV